MSSDPHIPLFTYVPPAWSVGDRLVLALSFADAAALRSALVALRLHELESFTIHAAWCTNFRPPLQVFVFGTSFMLKVGPEDAIDFLESAHVDQARDLSELALRAGLARFVVEPFDSEIVEANPRLPSQAHRLLAQRAALLAGRGEGRLVQVTDAEPDGGFATRILAPPRERRQFIMPAPQITTETWICDFFTGAERSLGDLCPGAIAVASLSSGRVSNAIFGLIAHELAVVTAREADIESAGRIRAVAAALGIVLEGDDATRAALDRLTTDDGVSALVPALTAEILVARDAISPATLRSSLAITAAALRVMQQRGLPCLFDARAALASPAELAVQFEHIVAELDRSLAAAHRAERYLALYFGDESLPTYARLTSEERAALVEHGLVHERSGLAVNLETLRDEEAAKLDGLDPTGAAALRAVQALPVGELVLGLARLRTRTPSGGRIREDSADLYDAQDRPVEVVRAAARAALGTDAARFVLAKAPDEVLFTTGRGQTDLVRDRLLAKPPLAERLPKGHRVVILPSPSPSDLASGGVVVDGCAFLGVPVRPSFLSGYAEWLAVKVSFSRGMTWYIVLDVVRRRSSVADPRFMTGARELAGVGPGGVTLSGDGRMEHWNFHQLTWTPLDREWRWPAIPDAVRAVR